MNNKKRTMRIFFSFLVILLLWQIFAIQIENDIVLPQPWEVLQRLFQQMTSSLFYVTIAQTLFRVVLGFIIAFIMALCIAFLAYFYPWFEDVCYPLLLLTRSIPNISYIIIVLFWFSSETSVIVISFLILFPSIYANIMQGLKVIPQPYLDVLEIYPAPRIYTIQHVYIPFLYPYLFAATSSGISLAFKVGIMAEILGQVATGIGRQLNICRLQLDMAGVFAWTVWIILLLYGMEYIINLCQKRYLI